MTLVRRLFYFFSFFPALAINFGFGNIHLRFFSIFFFLTTLKKAKKIDIFFLLAALLHLLFIIFTYNIRKFHYLDLAYIVSYIYIYYGLIVVRLNPKSFIQFVRIFWILNIIYALYQNVGLHLGVDNSWVFFHQNTHAEYYKIPKADIIPFVYRVTGLFGESAPFVIYLMFTHFAFKLFSFSKKYVYLNLLMILLAGAKIGYAYLFLLFFPALFVHLRISIPAVFLFSFFIILPSFTVLIEYLDSFDSLTSIVNRSTKMWNTIVNFRENSDTFFFGNGFISSHEIIEQLSTRTKDTFIQGNDFFSIYIYSVGILGFIPLLLPIIFWIKLHLRKIPIEKINLFYITIFLALIAAGSLKNYQYAYLIFILGGYIELRSYEK